MQEASSMAPGPVEPFIKLEGDVESSPFSGFWEVYDIYFYKLPIVN